MKRSFNHIMAIAGNTLTEASRQRVFLVLLLFGVVLAGIGTFATDFSFGDEFKFMKDSAYAAISIIGLIVALVCTSHLIPSEIEKRTIYTLLSKPVRRFEFIAGKYLGLAAVLTLNVVVMALMFFLLLHFKGVQMTEELGVRGHPTEQQLEQIELIRRQIYDPNMLQALLLLWAKLCIVIALAVLFSTVATSNLFIVCTTLLIYFVGHLQSIARDFWQSNAGGPELFKSLLLAVVAFLVPDFQPYNLIDEILAGNAVGWANSSGVLLYSGVYVAVVLVVSCLFFEEREL